MLELIETILSTTSVLHVVRQLAEMTVTDMMVVFLLSKPLFMIIALGAVLGGQRWGRTHYLHFQDCDRFLSQSSPGGDSCKRLPREMTFHADYAEHWFDPSQRYVGS